MKIESKIGASAYPAEHIYNFIADFRNFNSLIPQDRIQNWEADADSCSFSMDMLGKLSLKHLEKEAPKLLKIITDPANSKYNLTLWIQIKEINTNDTRLKITLDPELNQMTMMMAKAPLKKFVDSLIDQIEGFDFQNT